MRFLNWLYMWGHTAPAAGHRKTRVRKSESPFRATSVLSTEPSPWWAPLTSPLLHWVNVHFLFTFPTKQNSVTKTSTISFDMLDTIMRMKLFSILTLPHNLHMNQTCWEQLKSTGGKKKDQDYSNSGKSSREDFLVNFTYSSHNSETQHISKEGFQSQLFFLKL